MEFDPALIAALRAARTVVALTGSGISAASGIPTYRGADGTWEKYDYAALSTRAGLDADPGGYAS
ncbi:MAG TPA: Sir2 family NAD-dependent protein deacetylase [Herpetosiphonaceae bacterium]